MKSLLTTKFVFSLLVLLSMEQAYASNRYYHVQCVNREKPNANQDSINFYYRINSGYSSLEDIVDFGGNDFTLSGFLYVRANGKTFRINNMHGQFKDENDFFRGNEKSPAISAIHFDEKTGKFMETYFKALYILDSNYDTQVIFLSPEGIGRVSNDLCTMKPVTSSRIKYVINRSVGKVPSYDLLLDQLNN